MVLAVLASLPVQFCSSQTMHACSLPIGCVPYKQRAMLDCKQAKMEVSFLLIVLRRTTQNPVRIEAPDAVKLGHADSAMCLCAIR